MPASSKRLCGSAYTDNYTVSGAGELQGRLSLAFRDDDVAAEGAQRQRRAAVAERGTHRPVADAAAPPTGVPVAADGQRQIRADAAAEGARRQLEAGGVRQGESHVARVHVDVVHPAAVDGAAVFEPAADRLRV